VTTSADDPALVVRRRGSASRSEGEAGERREKKTFNPASLRSAAFAGRYVTTIEGLAAGEKKKKGRGPSACSFNRSIHFCLRLLAANR